MPLSTILSYIVAVSFIGGEKHQSAASHWQSWLHNVVSRLYTSPWAAFELITLVVIGIDCIDTRKSYYNTITTMTASHAFTNTNEGAIQYLEY